MRGRWIAGPLGLAVVVTLINAIKPVLIDDTAYLLFARHLSQHPLDPYGFTLHWYTFPDRAMDVLLPPVLSYWLALGIAIFGEHIVLLKLWLFPFVWCFTKSLDVLLQRFARGTERVTLSLIVLSPAVLPTVNFMLDIPAAALGLAALAVLTDRRLNWKKAVFAGLLAGLAMQTKYTAMIAPAAIAWYGLTHRRVRPAIVACVVSVLVFATWEALLHEKYGESHFLHHLAAQREGTGNWFQEKAALIPGLFGHLGLLGFGTALFAARPLGIPNRFIIAIAVVWSVGVLLVCGLPAESLRARNVWRPAGAAVLIAAIACSGMLLLKRRRLRFSRGAWFVVGWLLLEVAGYFALTPFPAARRIIGFTIVFGILAARVISRVPSRKPPSWVLPFAIWIGILVAALDTFDASAESVLAERAAAQVRGEKRVWFAGHWGFQYYAEHAGFRMIVPGESILHPGDLLVLPIYPDDDVFHRPYIGLVRIRPPKNVVLPPERFQLPFAFPAQTIPNFYGGSDPIDNQTGDTRLRVAVYRIVKSWKVPGK